MHAVYCDDTVCRDSFSLLSTSLESRHGGLLKIPFVRRMKHVQPGNICLVHLEQSCDSTARCETLWSESYGMFFQTQTSLTVSEYKETNGRLDFRRKVRGSCVVAVSGAE